MSRRKKSSKVQVEDRIGSNGLPEPYPSSPVRPPKFVIYCYRGDQTPRRQVVYAYCAMYAAQALCEAMLEEGECEFVAPDRAVGDNGVELRSDRLKDILYHRKTLAEMGWSLSEKEQREVRQFLSDYAPRDDYEPRERKAKGEKSGGRAVSRTGLVTIAELAEEFGMKPREARGILRSADEKKPESGWCWTSGSPEIERIRKLLKEGK